MSRWWNNLSVPKKLFGLFGTMAVLVAAVFFTLLFAMSTLSSIRAFVRGEGIWSKAQKMAVIELERYVHTFDERHYDSYLQHLKIPLGGRKGRLELEKEDYNPEIVKAGFLRGGAHPGDIPGMIRLVKNFRNNFYINKIMNIWDEADNKIYELMAVAANLKVALNNDQVNQNEIQPYLAEIEALDERLTELEFEFSETLTEGSRWMEKVLLYSLLSAIALVECFGLMLTFFFGKKLNLQLSELKTAAEEVGRGNFDYRAPVRSADELGILSQGLNKMAQDLKNQWGRREAAESANQLKTVFLANMSHEIRTPIGVILGLVDLLKDPHLAREDVEKYLRTIERTGDSLVRLINDILDLSKIESGKFEMDTSTFSSEEFIKDIQILFAPKAKEKNIEFSFDHLCNMPKYLETDRTRLQQIVVNLINNAIKFTDKGSVTVSSWFKHNQLFFKVSDTGLGIDVEEQSKLFKIFSQTDSTKREISRGAGLGLALSKRLAESMGGDLLLAESEKGKGSTFLAYIQAEGKDFDKSAPVAKPNEAVDVQGRTLKDLKLLVVDDNVDMQELIGVYLSQAGIKVDFAADGVEGVNKALAGDYDFVFMDIQMSVQDGYKSTSILRTQKFDRPIIALTANAMKEDRDKCLQSGCNDYITKPFRKSDIYEVLARHI